jgi:CRISPR system Cascade subunit CasC
MTSRSKFTGSHLLTLVTTLLPDSGVSVTDEILAEAKRLSLAETKKLTTKEKRVSAGKKAPDKSDAKTEGASSNNDAGDTLVWLAESEMRALAQKIVVKLTQASGEQEDLSNWIHPSTSSLTIAGFGRMFASAPEVQTEAAVQLAHAFTTHAAVTEIDYFTAVDDLRATFMEDAGAGHLDLAEFTSGVFYRYLNVDRRQLAANWTDLGESDAHQRLAEWFSSLLLSLPSGKINATAPLTLPFLIIAQESSVPVSFADAFEAAVTETGSGFANPSRARLLDYQAKSEAAAGSLFGGSKVLDLAGLDVQGVNLDELTEFAVDWVLRSE